MNESQREDWQSVGQRAEVGGVEDDIAQVVL